MQLLLDSHVFLWWVEDDKKLSKYAKTLISDVDNDCFISAATAWELAIKTSQGKLKLSSLVSSYMLKHMQSSAFTWLDIKLSHIDFAERLPYFHKDPFDRLLIAQAQTEKLVIVSADIALDAYDVERIW